MESYEWNKVVETYVYYFAKQVDDEMLKILCDASDIFVMQNIPVECDMGGLGIVAMEAASCGMPVVASNIEGIKDVIKDGGNGILIEPYSVNQFTDTIADLLKNPNKNNSIVGNSRDYTLNNYRWNNISDCISGIM